ncbi:MAG: hypothetical protein JJU19_03605 [Pararhodobacter sp.]|nr:hypothetical protein [Pararhodobacter sp.]
MPGDLMDGPTTSPGSVVTEPAFGPLSILPEPIGPQASASAEVSQSVSGVMTTEIGLDRGLKEALRSDTKRE